MMSPRRKNPGKTTFQKRKGLRTVKSNKILRVEEDAEEAKKKKRPKRSNKSKKKEFILL